MKERLPPSERLRKKQDFRDLYKKGHRHRGKYFNLVYLSNDLSHSRMAVVASKKIGKAVERNRVKRRMRELFRRNKELLPAGFDILLIAKAGIAQASWESLKSGYLQALVSLRSVKSA